MCEGGLHRDTSKVSQVTYIIPTCRPAVGGCGWFHLFQVKTPARPKWIGGDTRWGETSGLALAWLSIEF